MCSTVKTLILLAVLVLGSVPVHATSLTVIVPATVSIWLANQPNGTINPNNTDAIDDVAPQSSPVLISLAGNSNGYLTFQSTGVTSRDPNLPLVNAGGVVGDFTGLPGVFSYLSGLSAPFSSLVGVFIDSRATYSVPPTLNFASVSSRSFVSLSPQLQQIFFIGDGLTGEGVGDLQSFQIPQFADSLFLATFDSGSFNNIGELQVAINFRPSVLTATIEIKPGSDPAPINPRSVGVIPVAILTTPTFNAATVDASSVRFGKTGTEAAAVRSALEDVDGNGTLDMILKFQTQGTGITCGDTSAFLNGQTFSKLAIQGSDAIKTVGCH